MIKKSPPTKEEEEAGKKFSSGLTLYTSTCVACHGADRRGGVGPELLTMKDKFNIKDFQHLLNNGKGEMPAFPNLSEDEVKNIYNYITTATGGGGRFGGPNTAMKITGPVVDSGGAPGGLAQRRVVGPAASFGRPGDYGIPYPDGVDAPKDRYFIPPGYGLSFPYIIRPPWSTIAAYDLNTGKIKWQVPVGTDLEAANEGAENTGILAAQRQGMIVTSSGILFCTGRDKKIYAFDVDNGKELWSYELPTGTEGIPAMYEINGKHYLVICATTTIRFGRNKNDDEQNPASGGPTPPSSAANNKGSYIVFALPDKK